MPSLFSSRRRGSSAQPPVDRNTSAAATVAAGQAFMGRAASTANLSSAAAAAALRSNTTSPELVANVQTKRMQRRASTSSAGSGSGSVVGSGTRGGVGRGGLQRTNSGGSMTERTFRSPSPGRQNSTASQTQVDEDAPPVPSIPNGHRRSASLDPPERIMSPTPAAGKRGSSVDRASMAPKTTSRPTKRLSNVNEEQANVEDGPSSPSSRNFSRPMSRDESSTGTSITKNKYTHGQGSWFTQSAVANDQTTSGRPRTSDGPPTVKAPGVDMPITNPRIKKRISSAPGSHLSQANRNSIATSEPAQESDSIMVFDPNSRTFITKRRNRANEPDSPVKTRNEQVYDPNTRSFISRAQADAEPEVPPPAPRTIVQTPISKKAKPTVASLDTTLQPPPKNPARYSPVSESPTSPRAMGFLHKQPSVVREDREAEEEAEASQPKGKQSRVVSQPASNVPAKAYKQTENHQRSSSLDVPRGESATRGRNTSLSPQRSTRFSVSPMTDATIHNPPGRDVSPAKSALKHSPSSSVRANSPLVGGGSMGPPSESDTMSDVGSQDGLAPKRKKSVRVSFDEHAHEIAATAPVLPMPVDDEPSDDDDAIMKPRPALPSFGSVRGQRMSPEPAEKVTEMPPDREGSSSDAALGSILAGSLRGEGKKVERDSSPLDPLPPEVTSREWADYASDSSSETNVPAPITDDAAVTDSATRDFALDTVRAAFETPTTAMTTTQDDAYVPAIALQPPTPGAEDDSKKELSPPTDTANEVKLQNRRSRDLSMPGGWGDDEEDEPVAQPTRASESAPEPVPEPASAQLRRSSSEDSAATQTITPIQPVLNQAALKELSDISEDSDDSAAFSDAAEDLSDLEDGGFASLDAMVETPMPTPTPLTKKSNLEDLDEAEESPSAQQSSSQVQEEESERKDTGDWGQATAYWSKLSRQQKEQIERDALSDDEEPKVAPLKPKAKKKQPSTSTSTAELKPALKQQPVQPSTQPAQSTSMRKSMRAQPGPAPAANDGGTHMRRSMRSGGSGGGGGMMSSVREGPPQRRQRPQSEHIPELRGALQKSAARPKSSGGLPSSASGTAMRQSMRPGSSDSDSRPMPIDSSYPPLPNKRASQQSQPQRKAEPPVVTQRLQKELSKGDDSDSESSFRKQRRRNRTGSDSTTGSRGGFAMRRSMRGGPPEAAATTAAPPPRPVSPEMTRGSKWSMRSLSPTGNFFGRNKQPPRASVDSGTRTTLRAQPPAARNAPAPAPAAKPRPSTSSTVAAPSASSRFKSRFAADSDDEDDSRPAKTFRSRFADSDDEDDGPSTAPANLTPVRGIPKRRGQEDGDSTDLEEEEDDNPRKGSRQRQKQTIPLVPDPSDVEKAMAAARRNLGIQENSKAEPAVTTTATATAKTEGGALQQGSLRKKQPGAGDPPQASPQPAKAAPVQPMQVQEKKKRGFMGSILRRNRSSQASIPQVAPPSQVPATPAAATASPQANKSPATPSSPSSPTANKLRRSSYQNPPPSRLRRGDSDLSTATAPEMYGSNNTANRDSGNWPLASPSAPPVPKIPEHLSNTATPTKEGAASNPTSPHYFNDAKADQDEFMTPDSKGRPSTSDGVSEKRPGQGSEIKLAKTMRPGGGMQRTASEQVSTTARSRTSGGHVSFLAGDEGSEPGERPADVAKGVSVYSRRTGKKKKFGMLRRAFGLDD